MNHKEQLCRIYHTIVKLAAFCPDAIHGEFFYYLSTVFPLNSAAERFVHGLAIERGDGSDETVNEFLRRIPAIIYDYIDGPDCDASANNAIHFEKRPRST